MPIKPPRRGIRLRKTRRCVCRATVNSYGSRRRSLSPRNAFASESIINPSIGLDVGPSIRIPPVYVFMQMNTRSLLTTITPSSSNIYHYIHIAVYMYIMQYSNRTYWYILLTCSGFSLHRVVAAGFAPRRR